MSWTQPLCNDCWNLENPERPARDGATLLNETCCMCGAPTQGIYIRRDPATVLFPAQDDS